jgi:hypothetical protein
VTISEAHSALPGLPNREEKRAQRPSYGRPLDFGDGYDKTPAELRMPPRSPP